MRVPLRPHSHGGEEEDAVSLNEVPKGNVPSIPAGVITKWLSCVCLWEGGGGQLNLKIYPPGCVHGGGGGAYSFRFIHLAVLCLY